MDAIKKHSFHRTNQGRWYIDLPGWTGPKSDLEMVAGADDLLDVISSNKSSVTLLMSDEPFDGSERIWRLDLRRELPSPYGGADYLLDNYNDELINHELWLCHVTKFVFGHFPNTIYFKVTDP